MEIKAQNLFTAIEENVSRIQADPAMNFSRSRIGEIDGIQIQIVATATKENKMPKYHTHEALVESDNPFDDEGVTYVPRLSATYDDYVDAVETLMEVAQHDTGGGAAAAQVLLGLYNSGAFHVDLVDVACRLDANNRYAALVAILGRGQLMREPHLVIEDGDNRFGKLWKQWGDLHVSKRYARHYPQNGRA